MSEQIYENRVATLARFALGVLNQTLGRTQMMKLFYFLQELKGVPLGYDFRLYTYGPYESEVLSDLSSACGRGAVTENAIQYGRGYGYAITPAQHAEKLSARLASDHPDTARLADEVVRDFGSFSAGELELRSTIFYVDREAIDSASTFLKQDIADRVHQIKPHFTVATILECIRDMVTKRQLQSISDA